MILTIFPQPVFNIPVSVIRIFQLQFSTNNAFSINKFSFNVDRNRVINNGKVFFVLKVLLFNCGITKHIIKNINFKSFFFYFRVFFLYSVLG